MEKHTESGGAVHHGNILDRLIVNSQKTKRQIEKEMSIGSGQLSRLVAHSRIPLTMLERLANYFQVDREIFNTPPDEIKNNLPDAAAIYQKTIEELRATVADRDQTIKTLRRTIDRLLDMGPPPEKKK